jgi:BlaI family penicillinase repressor
MDSQSKLSRRERQIMDAIYQLGRATVAEVMEKMADPPSYSAVRALMGILEQKGQLAHEQEGARYVYRPVVSVAKAQKSALKRLVDTFFNGSPRGETFERRAAPVVAPDRGVQEGRTVTHAG